MAVSITPVVEGAAVNGPPPPEPSMYRKAICFPSCDQRGRAAYPFRFVTFFGLEPSALTVHSCRCAFSPALEKNVNILESGDHAGSKSVLSPVIGISTSLAGAFPEISRICVSLDVVAAVDCIHAMRVASGDKATSPYKTVLPSFSVNCCMFCAANVMGTKQTMRKCFIFSF